MLPDYFQVGLVIILAPTDLIGAVIKVCTVIKVLFCTYIRPTAIFIPAVKSHSVIRYDA
jgi:hypothetical protein